MPQIDQIGTIYASQLLWLLVVFAIIYLVIGNYMMPKIEGTIHARNDRISGDLAAAEQARDEASAIHAAYDAEMDAAHKNAHDAVKAAKDSAARDTEAKLKAAQAEALAKTAQAEAAIADARGKALGDLETVAADAVRDIVERLSGAKVGEDEALGAVRASLAA